MAELEVSVSGNIDLGAIDITLYEDVDSDGVAENISSKVAISSLTYTDTFSGFDGSSGNDVWVSTEKYGNIERNIYISSIDVNQTPPNAPSDLTVSEGSDNYLTWTSNSTDHDGFEIFRSETSGSSIIDYSNIASTSGTSYTDTTALDGERYYYRVGAYNDSGINLSNEDSGTVTLPAPSNLTFTTDQLYSQNIFSRWNFEDDADTTTLTDTVGTNDGTINGMTYSSIEAEGDYSGFFGGSSDYVDISGFGWGNTPITITLWLYPYSIDDRQPLYIGDGAPQFEFARVNTNSGMSWFYYDGSSKRGITADGTIPGTYDWSHIALTYDPSNGEWEYYLNSTLEATANDQVSINISGIDSSIGRHPVLGRYFDGRIDDIRIYDDILSSDKISAIYNKNS